MFRLCQQYCWQSCLIIDQLASLVASIGTAHECLETERGVSELCHQVAFCVRFHILNRCVPEPCIVVAVSTFCPMPMSRMFEPSKGPVHLGKLQPQAEHEGANLEEASGHQTVFPLVVLKRSPTGLVRVEGESANFRGYFGV